LKDGQKVISAGADKQAKVLDLATGQSVQIAQHEQPIRCVRYFEANGTPMAVTGSWDKTDKTSHIRTPTGAGS
jgi:mRNA export factor